MSYYIDLKEISIDQYKEVLRSADLLPSWMPLRENIDENLNALKRQGIHNINELLDNIMLYWLPNTGASSARLYWESFAKSFGNEGKKGVQVPTGCSIFPKEIIATPRSWAEQRYKNIQYWNELDKGGHFAAFEQPETFVQELRKCFSILA